MPRPGPLIQGTVGLPVLAVGLLELPDLIKQRGLVVLWHGVWSAGPYLGMYATRI